MDECAKEAIFTGLEGLAYHAIIRDDCGVCVDHEIISANCTWMQLFNLEESPVRCMASRVLHGTGMDTPEFVERYVEAAGGSEPHTTTLEWGERTLELRLEPAGQSGFFSIVREVISGSNRQPYRLRELIVELLAMTHPIDHRLLAQRLRRLSGAKYVALSLYDDALTCSTTRAVVGDDVSLPRAESALGMSLEGAEWPLDPDRLSMIDSGQVIRLQSIEHTSMGALPKSRLRLLEEHFDCRSIHVLMLVSGDGTPVGDAIFFMSGGDEITNDEDLEAYAGHLATLLVRDRIEARLRHANNHFEQLAEGLEEVFWVRSADTEEMLYVSPAYERIWGRSCAALYRNPSQFFSAILPEDRSAVACAYEQYGEDGHFDMEYRIRRPDGQIRWIWARSFPIRDDRGRVVQNAGMALDITELKDNYRALAEEERRFANLVDNIPGAIFRCAADADCTMHYISDAIEEITGYRASDFANSRRRTFRSVVREEDRAAVLDAVRRSMQDGASYEVDYRIRHRDGTHRWVRENGRAVLDSAGAVCYLDGAIFDVTEERRQGQELRDNQEYLNSLLEALPDIVFHLSEDGEFLNIFTSADGLLYASRDELLGRSIDAIFPRELAEQFLAHIRSVLKTDTLHTLEYMLPGPQGNKWFEARSVPLPQGGVLSIVVDVSSAKRAERALLESEQNLRSTLDSIGDGVVATDAQGNVAWMNPVAESLTGWPIREALGSPLETVLYMVNARSREPVMNPATEVLRSGRIVELARDTVLIARSGKEYDIADSAAPITDDAGALTGVVMVFRDITEQRVMERALAESRRQLELFFSQSLTGFFFAELPAPIHRRTVAEDDQAVRDSFHTLRFTRVNRAMLEQYCAREESDLIGINLADPFIEELSITQMRRLFSEGHLRAETREHRLDGSEIWVLGEYRCIYDGDYIIGAFGTQTDISARKMTEDALRQSEERYRLLLDNSYDIIYKMDLAGCLIFVSPSWTAALGHPLSEVMGTSMVDFVHPSDRSTCRAFFARARERNNRSEGLECRIQHMDGSWRWHSVSATPVFEGDVVVGLVGTSQDITARVYADRAREESEQQFRTLFLESPASIVIHDRVTAEVVDANPRAWEIYGFSSLEELQEHGFWMEPPHSFDEALQSIHRAARGDTQRFEWKNRDVHGNIFWELVRLSPIIINGVKRVMATTIDITEQKESEHRLEELNHRLEEEINRAQEANRAKTDFLANMSHEVRTPLNGVLGMTELLLDTDIQDESRRYAESIRSSGEVLLSLINDILDYSKIEAGKLELEHINFDLVSLVEDFADTMAMRAEEKGLELLSYLHPGIPTPLRGDPGRLRQILANLLGNAIKFTSEGQVSLSVHAESLSTGDQDLIRVKFLVEDTGIGIPQDKVDALFERFTQLDSSTTRQHGGTGLGLAISRELVEGMGGQIGVDSQEGEGSTFWFTVQFETPVHVSYSSLPTMDSLRGIRTLIVDDNATSREILTRMLAHWDMSSVSLDNPREALSELEHARKCGDPFGLVLVDMQMPGMDGEQLGSLIRADDRWEDVRLVMLTSMAMRGQARRLADIGFDGYLSKPIRRDELRGVLVLAMEEGASRCETNEASLVTRHIVRERTHPAAGRGRRVLVVEDNRTNQQVALGVLRNLGFDARGVDDGLQALEMLMTEDFEAVLMDVQMPVMDGLEATRRIRSSGKVRQPDIPIIALTARALTSDRENCMRAGMNEYLSKPVKPAAVMETLERALTAEGEEEDRNVFDAEEFLQRALGDEDLAREILVGFIDDTGEQLEALKAHRVTADFAGAAEVAHTLKGAAATISAEEVRVAASRVETVAKRGEADALAAAESRLREAYARLCAHINRTIEEESWEFLE